MTKKHQIYISKKSILGHGISFKKFQKMIDFRGLDVFTHKWDVTQTDWVEKILELDNANLNTVIVPSFWALDLPNPLPDDFKEKVASGSVRIVGLIKKTDKPNEHFPGLFIPSDRGEKILSKSCLMVRHSSYIGLHALFPLDQKIYFLKETTPDTFKDSLNQVLKQLMDDNPVILEKKQEIEAAVESLVRVAMARDAETAKTIELALTYDFDILGISIKWKTSIKDHEEISTEWESLKGTISLFSAIWNVFHKEISEREYFALIHLEDPDRESFPEEENAYPIGVDIIGPERQNPLVKRSEEVINEDHKLILSTTSFVAQGPKGSLKGKLEGTDFEGDHLTGEGKVDDLTGDHLSGKAGVDQLGEKYSGDSEVDKLGGEHLKGEGGVDQLGDKISGEGQVDQLGGKNLTGEVGVDKLGGDHLSGEVGVDKLGGVITGDVGVDKIDGKEVLHLSGRLKTMSAEEIESLREANKKKFKQNGKILLVCENEDMVKEFQLGFQIYDVKTHYTTSSVQAQTMIRNQKFHFIVTCLELEKGDGIHVINRIKKDPSNQNFRVPIILLVKEGTEKSANELKSKRLITGYLNYPIDASKLMFTFKKMNPTYF